MKNYKMFLAFVAFLLLTLGNSVAQELRRTLPQLVWPTARWTR